MALRGISVEGLRELRAALREAEGLSPKAVSVANKSAAQIVLQRAMPNIPRRTGALAASTRALGSQTAGQVKSGSARVPYAAAIHWGRRRGNVGRPPGNHMGRNPIRGRPYLWDAARRALPEVVHEYKKAIDEIVVRAIRAGALSD